MPRNPTPAARAVRAAMAICLALASASAVLAQPAYVPAVVASSDSICEAVDFLTRSLGAKS